MLSINRIRCPQCGERKTIDVIDKGAAKYLWRRLTFSSRLLCRSCNITWRRNTPHHFSPLKRVHKHFPFSLNAENTIVIKPDRHCTHFLQRVMWSLTYASRKHPRAAGVVILDLAQCSMSDEQRTEVCRDFRQYVEIKGRALVCRDGNGTLQA